VIVSLLLLGFLLGMKHALEADHVAAVAALSSRSSSIAERVKLAGAWGIGHAGTIIVLGVGVFVLGFSLPAGLARRFEAVVGFMLIVLGADVLRRLFKGRVHFHTHRHDGGRLHLHAHAHRESGIHDESGVHDPDLHHHEHTRSPLPRALLVGSVHGLAGSAALVLLSVEAAHSATQALGHLAAFGIGSILGMMALSLAISVPLRLSALRLGPASRRLEGALGVVTIALGSWIAASVLIGP
jgi:cytochrome c biogenesis protein CcdA